RSFDVLHQLPDFFQYPFDLNHVPGDPDIVRLRADRVGFPKHLLRQEIELPAGAFRFVDDVAKLLEVTGQADHLLGNVASFRENRNFLDEFTTVNVDVEFGQEGSNALVDAVAKRHGHLG